MFHQKTCYNKIGDNKMNILEIIEKKKKNQELSKEEIEWTIKNYLEKQIEDYQMSSLLMAITLNGMTEQETIDLTNTMLNSGEIIDLNPIEGIKVDKHSTGGVGDKTTIILAPLVASLGVKVAKMSGRGLGHTGGTIDKLESIPGFQTNMSLDQFINQVNQYGLAIVGQMKDLVPADKKLYALRDVTGTVDSIPLIASSIMSKKLASGADKIIIDVKVGDGALIKNKEDARKLARLMIKIGNSHQKEIICILTNMNQPLGYAIGNSLEIQESIDMLKGEGPLDLQEIVLTLGSYMVASALNISLIEAQQKLEENIKNGKAYQKFEELISLQQGNLKNMEQAPKIFSVKSPKEGFIQAIHTEKIGEIARKIGAGRYTKEDQINPKVGLTLSKKVGDPILVGEELVKVYLDQIDLSIGEILSCFDIKEELETIEPVILEIITSEE